jgi:hypothetical protein
LHQLVSKGVSIKTTETINKVIISATMSGKATWTHLVRFEHKGDPTFAQLVSPKDDGDLEEQFEVEIATGDPVFNNVKLTGKRVTVARNTLLAPFATVPIVINTGLNYDDHVNESLFYSAPVVPKCFNDDFAEAHKTNRI